MGKNVTELFNQMSTEDVEFLGWIRQKHHNQDPKLTDELVDACANRFVESKPQNKDARAIIYGEERVRLANIHDEHLKVLAKIPCNS